MLVDGRFSLPVLKAGGMDLVDHLKEGLAEPDLLVDVKRLRRAGARAPIGRDGGRLAIEATATLTEIAASPEITTSAPVVAQAVGDAATPQVRNVATAAGNLLQRPRCWYYRNEQFDCIKKGGFMCFAAEGENRYHAILGGGPCYIVHPSNLAPALRVCGGTVHVVGGERETITIADLYHLPGKDAQSEHDLAPGEVVTHISLDSAPASAFYAIKEKQSFDWPLVAAAVALEIDGDRIAAARVCAAAVAPIPWPLPYVEEALAGVSLDDDAGLRAAAATSIDGALPLADNAYKTKLLPVAVRRAVLKAAGRDVEA
jgi:xanthine dehydrogenase YagS FAD-binding subunit